MFSYHDNKVIFRSEDEEETTAGSFTVTDYCITPNQDPNNRNFKMMVVHLEEGEFNFEVGRKASGDVADFFNSHIKSHENTFNHGAGELNFAFYGTLRLSIGGGKTRQETTLTFDNVCLAQGHSGSTNNWWFGIKGGQYDAGHLRTEDAEGKFTVDFFRNFASTDVSTVAYRLIGEWVPT